MRCRVSSSNTCEYFGPRSFTRSHLLATITTPRPARSASPPIAASCSAAPVLASTTSTTTSASPMALFAPATLTISTVPPRDTRPGRRMPAVSTMRNRRRCQVNDASIASRVVPGMSLTSTRSACNKRFTSEDLPTLGRPTMATVVSRCDSGLGTRGSLLEDCCSRLAESSASRVPSPELRAASPEFVHNRIKQLCDSRPMLCRNLEDRVDPELVELHRCVPRPLVVGLVDRHEQRLPRLEQLAGDGLVTAHHPFAAVSHHHHQVGALDGSLALFRDQIVERILARPVHAARIEELERRALPDHGALERIPRCPRQRSHDGAPRTGHPVEKRRFPHVRTADQHDRRCFTNIHLAFTLTV